MIVTFDRNSDHIEISKSMFFSFPANVDIVNIGCFFLIRSNRDGRGNGRFSYLLYFNIPLIFWFFKIGQSKLWLSV